MSGFSAPPVTVSEWSYSNPPKVFHIFLDAYINYKNRHKMFKLTNFGVKFLQVV